MDKCDHDWQVLDIIEGTIKPSTKPIYICMAQALSKCKKCDEMKELEIGIRDFEERPINELPYGNKSSF